LSENRNRHSISLWRFPILVTIATLSPEAIQCATSSNRVDAKEAFQGNHVNQSLGCLVPLIVLTAITVPPCVYFIGMCLPEVLAEMTGTRKRGSPDLDLGLTVPVFFLPIGALLTVAWLWRLFFRSTEKERSDE
jgi:hypothetical protein